jgi:excisionase family DNA binding protein
MAWINRISLALGVESKMRKKKSTTITFETERQIFISHRQSVLALCEACGYEVRLVSVNEAAATAGVNSLTIYRLVDAGRLHHAETGGGEVLVCTASLGDLISKQKG